MGVVQSHLGKQGREQERLHFFTVYSHLAGSLDYHLPKPQFGVDLLLKAGILLLEVGADPPQLIKEEPGASRLFMRSKSIIARFLGPNVSQVFCGLG